MAIRPIFKAILVPPYFERKDIDFPFFNGFSLQQKQRSIQSLHNTYHELFPDSKVLEISTKSKELIGTRLSAFNLQINMKSGRSYSVEQLFQSSKTFENGGPYTDLLAKRPKDAKRDSRLYNSGKLIRFELGNLMFELEPKTYFYNWLYINALDRNPELSKAILDYDSFSDIEFNPQKSLNCQAEAAAIYVGLCLAGKIDEALANKEDFLRTVYQSNKDAKTTVNDQMNITDLLGGNCR